MRRLMKDYKEIEENRVPTVGVTAKPLDSDLFTWHGNIRGPEKTPYEGGVFHLQLQFTPNYPLEPPSVTIFAPLTHPNIIGQTLCLDMFSTKEKTLY